jgi:5'-nucleotidase/UDP-sugar diphosphatase
MKKLPVIFALLALVAMMGFAAPGDTTIAVIHWNDMHGHPLAFADHGVPEVSGLPAITTLVGQTRAEYNNVLVLDAGDYDTGRPESDFFKAEPMIVGYNLMQVDAVTLGNHEFDNARSVLDAQKALADFPLISANVTTKDGKYLADAPYTIKTFDGVKVGIFGLTTTETRTIGTPDNVKDVTFADEVTTAKAIVTELRGKMKCDVVIALVHMGLYSDNKSGSRLLAAQVPGIDLIVDGHSHTAITAPVMEKAPDGKMVPIVQAYNWGLNVGKGVLTIKNKKVTGFDWQALTINDKKVVKNADGTTTIQPVGPQFEQNPIVQTALVDYLYKVDAILGSKIGVKSTAVFPNALVRKAETELGDLVCDGLKWVARQSNPDFAICGGGTIRTDLPAGDLTVKHIYTVLPFDNTVVICTLKGSEVQNLFNFIATIPQTKGGFPQVSDGVSYTLNYDKGVCENILIGGKPIDPAKDYKIATNDYMAAGGDGYVVFKKSSLIFNTSIWMRDGVIDYLKTLGGTITPVNHNRITIIGSKLAFLFVEPRDLI